MLKILYFYQLLPNQYYQDNFLAFISNYKKCEQRLYLEIEEEGKRWLLIFFLFLDALLICCRWHFDDAISEWTYYFQEAVG